MYHLAAQCTPHGKLYFVHYTWYMNSHFLCHLNRFFQCAELVVHFLQFVLVVALGYDAAACLEPEDTVAADKSTNRNRLVQRAVQSDETDAAAVGSTVVRFQLLMSCMARTLGAPLRVPAGKVSMKALTGSASSRSVPLTRLTRWMTWL